MIVGSGLTVTVGGQLVCADCGKLHPLEANIAAWLPGMRAALGGGKDILLSLSIGYDPAAHTYNTTVAGLRGIAAHAGRLASDLTALALAHGFAGFDVDVEAACCAAPGGPTGNDCPCDDAFATELAGLFGEVTAALRPHGKTLSLDVNEHGSGYLTMPYYGRYLAAGVGRLRQMGTYGLNNRTGITQALLRGWPVGRV